MSTILHTTDPRVNYIMGTQGIENDFYNLCIQDYIPLDKVDYTFTQKGNTYPLSYMHIDNIEDGYDWFKYKYPKLPDELCEVMSKYHFGDELKTPEVEHEVKIEVVEKEEPPLITKIEYKTTEIGFK